MLRKLTKYILPFALSLPLFSAGGCADTLDTPDAPQGGAGMITLTLRNGEGQTRANDDTNNESLIKNAFVALYKNSGDETQQPDVYQYFDNIDATKTTTVSINITDDLRASLFGNTSGNTCRMYVVCNVSEDALPEDVSISSLKGLQVSSAFATRKVQESFVMAGEGRVTYTQTGDEDSAAGSATVNRAAAKITLNIKLPASVEQDGEVWYPQTGVDAQSQQSPLLVLLSNGVENSVAAPALNWKPESEDDYFDITTTSTGVVRSLRDKGSGEYRYGIDVPFYTYPNTWTNTPDETHRTVMTLIVPWRRGTSNQYQSFYYQVPVTNMEALVANYSYTVNLNVGMLGSLVPEKPIELPELSYQVINWGKEDIEVDIKDSRYLVVSPTIYTANNEEEITIPYYSSHPVEITNIEIKYSELGFVNQNGYEDSGKVVEFTIPQNVINASVVKEADETVADSLCYYGLQRNIDGQTELYVNHSLMRWLPYHRNNSGTDKEVQLYGYTTAASATVQLVQDSIDYYQPMEPELTSFTPFTITVTLTHKDNRNYTETVTINQYPGLYIVADRNPGGSYYTSTGLHDYGFAFVNPTWTPSNNTYTYPDGGYWTNSSDLKGLKYLGELNKENEAEIKNPNMYVVNITTFNGMPIDEDGEYIIGDPRSHVINNDLQGATKTGNAQTTNWSNLPSTAVSTVFGDCVTSFAIEGGNKRQLKSYYPTEESDVNKMMIAPKIRIASQFGVMNNRAHRTNARRRCATYQEQQYPAGRWRVPTYAEMKFIVWLQQNNYIPNLFNVMDPEDDSKGYWTAQGAYKVKEDGSLIRCSNDNQGNSKWVRAVYDEWYWEQQDNAVLTPGTNGRYEFTWGDQPMNTIASQQLIRKYQEQYRQNMAKAQRQNAAKAQKKVAARLKKK